MSERIHREAMKKLSIIISFLIFLSGALANAAVYTGAMDNRAGFSFVPGFTAQTRAWVTGDAANGGMRLEWSVEDETNPGFWTYTYRLIRGAARNKGFAYFDIETAADFTASEIISRQVISATDRNALTIPSGLASISISNPVNFTAVHDYTNAAITEASAGTALNKSEMSHYSGDPARVAPGVPGSPASATPSVGPVPHPFYGIRVTFPGSFSDLAYEVCEWEFQIVASRVPMWGKVFGWGDQTILSPFWYSNFYNNAIDNPARLTLPPVDSLTGSGPYQGWVLVPGSLPEVLSTNPVNGASLVPITEPVTADFSGLLDPATVTTSAFSLTSGVGPVSGSVNYDQSSKRAIFIPDSPLAPNVTYTALIDSGVKDLAGNALTSPVAWSFTTTAVDNVSPSVVQSLPNDGAEYVSALVNFRATFSEEIDPATITPANFSVAGVTGMISYDAASRTATLVPSTPLSKNTTYTATIGAGVTDLAGNTLAAPFQWSVTTIPQETVLPYVVSTLPAARSANVVTTTSISATFSEPIDPATITPASFFVAGVAGTTTYDPTTLTAVFTPSVPLTSNTSYTLTVTTGVTDLAGNHIGLTKGFSFRTLNTLLPNFSLSGTVTGTGGTPLSGVTMTVTPTSQSGTALQVVVSDAAGHYQANQLLNGTYSITPQPNGRLFSPQRINVAVTTANVPGMDFASGVLTLSPDKPSPHLAGTAVIFTASAGVQGYDYRFWLYSVATSTWSMVQDYGVGSTWTLPSATVAGDYVVAVDARGNPSVTRDAVTYLSYTVSVSAATGVSLTPEAGKPNPSPAEPAGIVFAAAGQGSSGYDYRFWLNDGVSWSMVQDYGGGATWTMPASTVQGNYVLAVDCRTDFSVNRDVVAYLSYQVLSAIAPASGVTITPEFPSPHAAPVVFTAAGQGSSGYDYSFWLNDVSTGTWSMVQDYGNGAAWTLPGTTAAGAFIIAVNVRTSSAVNRDAVQYLTYVVQ